MSVKHSPGPWLSNITEEGELIVLFGRECNAFTKGIHFGDMEETEGEDHANADLIIAAPDLLAACKAALFPAGDTPQQIRDQLLAAIRKAEGTQQATEAGR